MSVVEQKILNLLHRAGPQMSSVYEEVKRIITREGLSQEEGRLFPLRNLSGYPRGWSTSHNFPKELWLDTNIYDNGDGIAVYDQSLSTNNFSGHTFSFPKRGIDEDQTTRPPPPPSKHLISPLTGTRKHFALPESYVTPHQIGEVGNPTTRNLRKGSPFRGDSTKTKSSSQQFYLLSHKKLENKQLVSIH